MSKHLTPERAPGVDAAYIGSKMEGFSGSDVVSLTVLQALAIMMLQALAIMIQAFGSLVMLPNIR